MPKHWRALVWVAAEGGLRWGEATELRRKDVTVERADDGAVVRALVNVERAVTVSSGLPDSLPHGAHLCDCRRGCLIGEPKSAAGTRSLYLYGDAAEALADRLARHALRFGNPLLFPARGDDSGQRHLSQSTFHTPAWSDARKAAEREDMPFHALRHYAGTRYAQAGATPRQTMARLGHSSVNAAMRYQHAGNRDEELAARMARRSTSA
ncbi:site-specific integrase [Microbacterium sp. CFBP 13617]|uniref:tyrosine-type recombinase/integrase n=1 Tax=Microbacterium sp. CFBP 13617 TaxID=2774035 RepID=UPI00177F8612|nr:site-specific integrase [Microbacterium sp. CFBP 13617]